MDQAKLSTLLARPKNIRNVCLVSHVRQGKTSFVKQLIASAKESGVQGNKDKTGRDWDDEDGLSIYGDDGEDSDEDGKYRDRERDKDRERERDRDRDKKSHKAEKEEETNNETTCTGIRYEMKEEDMGHVTDCDKECREFYVTLVDPTGHVDNNSEATSAIRVADGCIVIADVVTGIGSATESLIHASLADNTRPVLLLNRLDLSIDNLELEPEQLYTALEKCVWTFNKIVDVYGKPMYKVDPGRGSVAFGSALQGWAFTVHEFATMYTTKFKIDLAEMKQKLWGNHFFNSREKRWTTSKDSRSHRGFVQFVLMPVYKVINVCMYKGRAEIIEFAKAMDYPLSESEKLMKRDNFLKLIMGKWLPAGKGLLNFIVFHIPSPVTAQAKKTELLFQDNLTDDMAKGMMACDPESGCIMYVSRLMPTKDKSQLYAFGRVFSGRVHTQQRLQVMGPKHFAGEQNDFHEDGTIQSVSVVYDGKRVELDRVPCGVICSVQGIEEHIVKSATLAAKGLNKALRSMTFKAEPVVGMVVAPKEARDLPQLMQALKHLEKLDLRVQVELSKTGELSIWAINERHLNQCMEQLKETLGGVHITTQGPVLPYRETVTSKSPEVVSLRSEKGNNSFTMEAEPMSKSLIKDIEKGVVTPQQDIRDRAVYLDKKHKINMTYGKKLWCFGPDSQGPNLLFDCIKGGQPKHAEDFEPSVIAGFQWVTKKGALCEEAMRGVRYNLHHAMVDDDAERRTTRDILPIVLRVLNAAALSAKPRLMQPVYKAEIQCPESVSPDVYEVIMSRHGLVTKERSVKDWDTYYIQACIPVINAAEFEEELKKKTKDCAAMTHCVFDHWENLPGSPLDPRSKTTAIIRSIRARKGLSQEIPTVETFL